jgi:uncharacterized protein YjiS (DUF1127 family)
MGKLIRQKQEAGELASNRDNRYTLGVPDEDTYKQTLPDIGVTRKESSTSKNLAAVPDEEFEEGIQASVSIENTRQTLPDIGVTRKESSRLQRIARIPEMVHFNPLTSKVIQTIPPS